jgi:hypothetical protein
MIPAERIEVLPETRLCITCSRAVGGDLILTSRFDHTGKVGSIKKNIGGVTAKLRRKEIKPIDEE